MLTVALVASATVFLPATEDLLGRADYSNAAAEVKVVVVERGVEHTSHSAADGQQQHGQCATAQTVIIIVALRIRGARGCAFTGCYLLRGIASAKLRDARLSGN